MLTPAVLRQNLHGTLPRLLGDLISRRRDGFHCREQQVELSPGTNLLEGFQDLGIFRLNAPVHGHIFNRVFVQED